MLLLEFSSTDKQLIPCDFHSCLHHSQPCAASSPRKILSFSPLNSSISLSGTKNLPSHHVFYCHQSEGPWGPTHSHGTQNSNSRHFESRLFLKSLVLEFVSWGSVTSLVQILKKTCICTFELSQPECSSMSGRRNKKLSIFALGRRFRKMYSSWNLMQSSLLGMKGIRMVGKNDVQLNLRLIVRSSW